MTELKPGIEERYESAGNTSDLTLSGGMVPKDIRAGQGDVILAAGMSASFHGGPLPGRYYARSLGMALLRLHSEWSSAARPRSPPADLIDSMARAMMSGDQRMRVNGGELPQASALSRAHQEARKWYRSELLLFSLRLRSRESALAQLRLWAQPRGIDDDTLAQAMLCWLDQTCPVCDGLKYNRIAGQPALSARPCAPCQGSGLAQRPQGTAAILNAMDDAVQKARSAIGQRLRG